MAIDFLVLVRCQERLKLRLRFFFRTLRQRFHYD